jgi:hypothetical protein
MADKTVEITRGRLHYDRPRGVVYFYADDSGACLLRVEGLPSTPDGHQIDIHLFPAGSEHHHEYCDGVCAAKIVRSAEKAGG